MNVIKAIMPREGNFFVLFERHAEILVSAAEVVAAMFAQRRDIGESCRNISALESEADEVTREVQQAVRRTFITPFDRSAITGLISSMDDAVDEIQKTAKAVTHFEATRFDPQMSQIAGLAEQAARLVLGAMPLLRSVGRNRAKLDATTERIVHLEGAADELYDSGLSALYRTHRGGDALEYVVQREIYRHLEKVLDRLEDVADEIQGIVIDQA
ncbi:MAG TPA: DUF47 family protein [Allosphingosinicella sp.]|jgi:predicted phosphate transport protein (TIGR00153 family)|nr:DUF47 family protein [Allosphingosinicella sp.]